MPKSAPFNAEKVFVSPEDIRVLVDFVMRRSYNSDGSIQYVQVVASTEEIEAFAEGREPDQSRIDLTTKQSASLPRLIMRRKLSRILDASEVVVCVNGRRGDCRRENLELTSRSERMSDKPRERTSRTGEKYVYPIDSSFQVNINGLVLGRYKSVADAATIRDSYLEMLAAGTPEAKARAVIKEHYHIYRACNRAAQQTRKKRKLIEQRLSGLPDEDIEKVLKVLGLD